MLTLYYSPGACSLASHIALCENDMKFNLQKVDLATKKTEDGRDYTTISPLGYVPAMQLESGEKLLEGAAILFYITEQNAKNQITMTPNSFQRYHLQEALTFVSSEIHKTLGAFFDKTMPESYKEKLIAKIKTRFDYINDLLNKQAFIAGTDFSVADAYLFTVLRWLPYLGTGLSLDSWSNLNQYFQKIAARPNVQKALKEEGIA